MQLGDKIDSAVASALAAMLGGISVVKASQKKKTRLYPPDPDCVETAPVTVVGGIRKQNWQNMVNDLATEAATIHTRFPMAVVAFLVLMPAPALGNSLDPTT